MNAPLIPKQPRVMHQPRKDELRKQLVIAVEEIVKLRTEIERLRWWRRLPILRRRA